MKWFKFYGQDYISDPKMLSLTACERSCFITLLSYASVNDNGMITFLDEQQLMIQAGVSPLHDEWQQTLGILKKLVKLGIVTIDNEVITIVNWQKRQETSLTSYERVKRYREKKRNDNANDNDRVEENRIDKNNTTSEVELRVEKITSEVDKPQREKKDTTYLKVFELWGKYPLNWKKNTTQIAAAKNLLAEQEFEDIDSALKYYFKHKGDDWIPEILTPSDLDRKWLKLEAFYDKKHG